MRNLSLIKSNQEWFKTSKDRKKAIINLFLYYGLRFFLIGYGIIRIFLVNIYLGVTNFGLFNVMMLITPISLFLISACESKANYILYEYSLKKNYVMVNKLLNEQMHKMHYYSFISIFFLGAMMVIAYFFVKSPGLTGTISCLLILANGIGPLLYGIVLPYVQWYLNSLHLNYIYDMWEIFFSSILNILSFIIIILFGIHIIIFNHIDYEQSSTYIILIVTFLLSLRYMFANAILNLQKKKYMPWFKVLRHEHYKIFNANDWSYILQLFLTIFATTIIPLCFFIFSFFIHLSTGISGIYYSYITFVLVINLIGWGIIAIKPFFAKFMINNSSNDVFNLSKNTSCLMMIIGIILLLNFVIISPYIMIFTKSYFSFWLAFLIGLGALINQFKSVEEAIIYLHGNPEKYWKLTLYQIIFGLIFVICGTLVVFLDNQFSSNILNLLYVLTVSQIFMYLFKYIINLMYLNRNYYHLNFLKYLKDFWKLYLYLILIIAVIIITISLSKYITYLSVKFTNQINIGLYSNTSINNIFKDNIKDINYATFFITLIIINIILGVCTTFYLKKINPNLLIFIKNTLLKKN